MLKLITESIDIQSLQYLSEGVGNDKIFKIRGPMIQCELLNGNSRIYSKNLAEREVPKFLKKSKDDRLGEWEHPKSPLINRERAAVLIEDLLESGNDYIGTAKVLTKWPMGRIIFNSLEEGFPVGMSTRSLGTVDERTRRVNPDWDFRTIDAVPTPSGPNCFVEGFVEGILESKSFIIKDDLITEIAMHDFKKKLDKNGSKVLKEALKEFIRKIR